jgi:FixJ family two-component response regulator
MVAIIDDDQRTLNTAANLLSALGFRRQLYNSVEAFFADPQASQVGCVIADLRLANAGNRDFARRLSESGRSSPIIFTIGRRAELGFRQIMQARCLALVRKPFLCDELVDSLLRWLRLDRQEPTVVAGHWIAARNAARRERSRVGLAHGR